MNEVTLLSRHMIWNWALLVCGQARYLSGHVGCPQYSIFTIEQGGNILFFETWNAKAGDESAISDFPSRHQAPALWYCCYIYTNTLPDYWYQDDVLCILAGIYKLINITVPIIDFYDIDDVLYWFKYIYIYFSYVSLKLTYVAQKQLTM